MILIGTHQEKGHKVFIDTDFMGGDAYFKCYACDYEIKLSNYFGSSPFSAWGKNKFGINSTDYDWLPEGYIPTEDAQKKEADAWRDGVRHYQEGFVK